MKNEDGNDSCIIIITQTIRKMEAEQRKLYHQMRSILLSMKDAPGYKFTVCLLKRNNFKLHNVYINSMKYVRKHGIIISVIESNEK